MKAIFRIIMYVVMCFIVVNTMMYFLSEKANAAPAVNRSDISPDFNDCKTCQILNDLNPQWIYAKEKKRLMICFDPYDVTLQKRCMVFPEQINLEVKN
jgi:hypothetical protein